MKKLLGYLLILSTCLFLLGCQQSPGENSGETGPLNEDKSGESNSNHKDIFDFKHISKAPEATDKHTINEVIKVFFDEWSFDDPYEPIAINIEENEMYVNPSLRLRGPSGYEGIVQIDNAVEVLGILEKYEVQNWKTDYTFEDPKTYEDGYSWSLWLQFEDGTVEKHKGAGTDLKMISPDNFTEFAAELIAFANDKLGDNVQELD